MALATKANVANWSEAKKSTIFNSDGKPISFGAFLDQQATIVGRTLVVFIRHFFCGNCQEYVRRLAANFNPSTLPEDLSVVIIGCGAPSLISSYVQITGCPFSLYADPSTQLYKLLGMQRSLSLGSKGPAYIQHSLASGVVKSIVQGLKRIPAGDVAKAGDLSVNGGELLLTRPDELSEWTIDWSHCMANSRDHTEIKQLKVQLKIFEAEQLSFPVRTDLYASAKRNSESASCSDQSEDESCNQPAGGVRRSLSLRRRSWMIKAGQITRSSSLRRTMIQTT